MKTDNEISACDENRLCDSSSRVLHFSGYTVSPYPKGISTALTAPRIVCGAINRDGCATRDG